MGDGLILLPEQRRFERLCQQVSSALTDAGLKPEETLATLPQARDRVYARRYGQKPASSAPRRVSANRNLPLSDLGTTA